MIKADTINRKVKRIEATLTRLERGQGTSADISFVTDSIAWLWKFRCIDTKTFEYLADRATDAINLNKYY